MENLGLVCALDKVWKVCQGDLPAAMKRLKKTEECRAQTFQPAESNLEFPQTVGSRKMIQMLQLWFLTHVMRFYWKLAMPVSDFPTCRNYMILITYLYRVKRKKKRKRKSIG